jgi:hypothetical protein
VLALEYGGIGAVGLATAGCIGHAVFGCQHLLAALVLVVGEDDPVVGFDLVQTR